jgi:lysophospholipase L1-like esterase
MKLQTEIPLYPQQHDQIDYNSKILLLGSCFVENIGEKLDYFKFQNWLNPFGIVFHPAAIENLITNAINEKKYSEKDIFFHNEQWHCFEAHSKLSHSSKSDVLKTLNEQVKLTFQQIQESSHIIITLGTAWVYRYIESDEIVANCHKVQQKKFLKELLSVDEVSESVQSIVALIKSVNPSASIIFTVSPVRHLKDGFIENSQSKAHLITAVHQLVDPQYKVHYFPSYEIMMDELRDYRFYSEDMLHPNKTAIQYIWEKFQQSWIIHNSQNIMTEVDIIQKGLRHKPFNQNSKSHQKFLENLNVKIKHIQDIYSHFHF